MKNNAVHSASAENKMGVMPIFPLIMNMSLPIMLSMLVQALYNVVDSIFVSQLGEDALVAVSLAFPVQNLMISFGVGTSIGVATMVSTRLGQRKQDSVNRYAMNGVFLGVCNFFLFVILSFLFMNRYLSSQTSSEGIAKFSKEYLDIIINYSFGIFTAVMMERLLQSTGYTFLSMIGQMAGAVFNIIFDPLLIFGLGPFPKLGMAGAAYATVFGQILSGILTVILNITRNKFIVFKLSKMLPKPQAIAQIYKIAIPSILMSSIASVTVYFMNIILGLFTSTAVAVYGVYFKLQSFIFMPVFGLNNGLIPIIAYNYGAKNKERILKTIKGGVLIAFIIMLFGTFIFEVFPRQLFIPFNPSEQMISIGVPCFRFIALSFCGAAVGITFSTVFQALGNAFLSMIISFTRQIVILLPVTYFLSLLGDINKIWYSFIIAEVLSVLLSIAFMKRLFEKRIRPL